MVGARADRAVPLVPSRDRGHSVRQGRRLRCARRHPRPDRRLARLRLEAARRGGRGDVDEAGRGGARDRRLVPRRRGDERVAAGHAALHRLYRLSARFQPAQLGAGRAGRRRRHRRDAVHGVSALRLRLRAHDRAGDHLFRHGRRDALRPDAQAVPMSRAGPTAAAVPLRRWQRFTPAERILRSIFYLVVLLAIMWSFRTVEIIPEFLYDAPGQTADLFVRMWPIDWAWYPKVVHPALIETLHIATLGTMLAVVLAGLVALLVARNVTPSLALNTVGKFILVATRSVHAMVWALFFVAVFGPGALAGTLAIAV